MAGSFGGSLSNILSWLGGSSPRASGTEQRPQQQGQRTGNNGGPSPSRNAISSEEIVKLLMTGSFGGSTARSQASPAAAGVPNAQSARPPLQRPVQSGSSQKRDGVPTPSGRAQTQQPNGPSPGRSTGQASRPTMTSRNMQSNDLQPASQRTQSNNNSVYLHLLDDHLVGEEIPLPSSSRLASSSAIHSSGFYSQPGGGSTPTVNTKSHVKGKTTTVASQESPATPTRVVVQPLRVYKCPAADQPLYTLDPVRHTISIHASDADASYWPAKSQQVRPRGTETGSAPSPGTATWHEAVEENSTVKHKQLQTWMQKCGQQLAQILGLEGDPKVWKLAEWPKGYKMFIKHAHEGGQDSFFCYVIGSSFLGKRRFKTSKELAKHLAWLCKLGNDPRIRCKCKLCMFLDRTGQSRTAIIVRDAPSPGSNLAPPPPKKRVKTVNGSENSTPLGSIASGSNVQVVIPRPLSSAATPATAEQELLEETTSMLPKSDKLSDTSGTPLKPSQRPEQKARKTVRSRIIKELESQEWLVADTNSTLGSGDAPALTVTEAASTHMVSDTSNLGKRKRKEIDYYVPTIEEFAELDVAAAAALAEAQANGGGRQARSTRNNKSMRESPVGSGKPLPMYNGPFVHKKRHDDLKIHSAPFREHEVVWYRMQQAHIEPEEGDIQITHWPGEIVHKTLRVETKGVEMIEVVNEDGETLKIPQPINAQYYQFTVELFGLTPTQHAICKVDDLLPWSAYQVPANLASGKAAELLQESEHHLGSLEQNEDFARVLTTWAWARHCAIAIRGHFVPFGFYLDAETIKKMRRRRTQYYASSSGKRKKSNAEKDAREKEMEREMEMIKNSPQYYQGIWFGCEKIWVGELVRLAGTYASDAVDSMSDKACLQLYKGVKGGNSAPRSPPKGEIVPLDGLQLSNVDSEGRPAFFQITHIWRDPQDNGLGTLCFDGTFYEIVKEDIWDAEKPASLSYGGLGGTLDASDSSPSDQDALRDPATGQVNQELSLQAMYKTFIPPAPSGYRFEPLRTMSGLIDDGSTSTIRPFMIAGRYYPEGVLHTEKEHKSTRKLGRSCEGRNFKPDTQARPTLASVNRHYMVRASRKKASRDMQNFFAQRAEDARKAQESARRMAEKKARREAAEAAGRRKKGGNDDEDGSPAPLVTALKSSHLPTPAPSPARSKQTRVTEGSTEDEDEVYDTVKVATSAR